MQAIGRCFCRIEALSAQRLRESGFAHPLVADKHPAREVAHVAALGAEQFEVATNRLYPLLAHLGWRSRQSIAVKTERAAQHHELAEAVRQRG